MVFTSMTRKASVLARKDKAPGGGMRGLSITLMVLDVHAT
jgi:hypothetical protein